ncbi:phosphopyruvate hydratase [Rhodococcus sp. LB1]|uniref:phosphopyruvate hydratase n=1 Tax=Rhodococcus sp. LB1 TaxID=1807499 RepID=UPI000A49F566|nr:phosphopyruvate hydratase [Rhodococcus sp. LB1]
MSSTISSVLAWEALDSRGNPTVACEVRLRGGATGTAIAPSGASTGAHEAHELRDGGSRYRGKGVLRAVANVNGPLAKAVIGLDSSDQRGVDETLRATDGSGNLSKLGANAALAVSLATLKAAAAAAQQPLWRYAAADDLPAELPMPMINILSGGAHAGRAVDIQDVLVMPVGATSFAQALEWVDRVRWATAAHLNDLGYSTALVADEGGYGPQLPTNRAALDVVTRGIERAGFAPRTDVGIALDIAATQFFDASSQRYVLTAEDRQLTAAQWAEELAQWAEDFPVISIEDAMAEDDWEGWVEVTDQLGARTQIIGDDLFTTSVDRLQHGNKLGAANAVLVKPNQIGTVSDARALIQAANDSSYATVLSARSGETEESWLADLSVAWRTGQIKVGSLARSERTAKWNRLLQLEAELAGEATFAGRSGIAPRRRS